jgi:hypothetical protein
MSTRKTILVHGLLTAGVLAVVGYMFAQIAGMWVTSQTPVRSGGENVAAGSAISTALESRLPFTMAAMGFVLVAMGEGLRSLWRKPKLEDDGRVKYDATAEAETQRMLKDQAAQPTLGVPVCYDGRGSVYVEPVQLGESSELPK